MIKVIATDMDGTFLSDEKRYDKARFKRILDKMKADDIQFVVASGNQYRQLIKSFPEHQDEITFVAENGAHTVHLGETIHEHYHERDTLVDLIHFIEREYPDTIITLSGMKSAHMREDSPTEWVEALEHYQPVVTFHDSLLPLPEDDFFKATLLFPATEEATQDLMEAINERYQDKQIVGTSSGFGCIDVIQTGLHKGWALETLLEDWNLDSRHLMAFGDGGNDIEMLRLAEHSYAMANASDEVKATARYQTLSNNDNGVIAKIEEVLGL